MRLIDADYLKELISDYPEWNKFDKNRAIKTIDNTPTIDLDERDNDAFESGYIQGLCENRSLNEAIKTIKSVCENNNTCHLCPMNLNCNEHPAKWVEPKE